MNNPWEEGQQRQLEAENELIIKLMIATCEAKLTSYQTASVLCRMLASLYSLSVIKGHEKDAKEGIMELLKAYFEQYDRLADDKAHSLRR